MPLNSYDNYKEAQINSADKGNLILILYEGAINSLTEAIYLIKTPPINYEKFSKKILKTETFIFELMGSLNMDAEEIAHNLYKLYDFMIRNLIKGDVKKDVVLLEDILKMLKGLNESWEQIILNQNTTQPASELHEQRSKSAARFNDEYSSMEEISIKI